MQALPFDIWSILLGFGSLNGFFLALMLWLHQSGRKMPNKILAVLLLCISIFISELILARTHLYFDYPFLIMSTFPVSYFIGPLFYYYFKALLQQRFKFSITDVIHLLPVLMALFELIPFYFLESSDKISYINQFNNPVGLTFRHLWLGGIFLVQTMVYLGLTFKLLWNYENNYKQSASDTGFSHLEWLKTLTLIFALFIFLNGIVSALMIFGKIFSFPGLEITMLTLTLVTHVVGYNAIRHPQKIFPEFSTQAKYAKSSLTGKDRKNLLKTILKYMDQEKPFLDPELNLKSLADGVGLTTDHVSQVINAELSLNFYDFINQYRVKEAQQRLLDPQNNALSILGIALDSGFNSKTSFNRIFKKHVGMTPTSYILNNKVL